MVEADAPVADPALARNRASRDVRASRDGLVLRDGLASRDGPSPRDGPAPRGRRGSPRFAAALGSYWLSVHPQVRRELRGWRERALAIDNPLLRGLALQALAERGHMEGAAAFAVFLPHARRPPVVRAIVAFQTAYNYLDRLSEQPSPDPIACAERLHQALLVALDADARHIDYYARRPDTRRFRERDARGHRGCDEDGGYLRALVDACRRAYCSLPSYAATAAAARRAAERVRCFQAFNGEHAAQLQAAERWGREHTQGGEGLYWWETAAAAGSSLPVHALIALAAEPDIDARHVQALEAAYFPWIGALHSLLDHMIDLPEDALRGSGNLYRHYGSADHAATRMAALAERALAQVRLLAAGGQDSLAGRHGSPVERHRLMAGRHGSLAGRRSSPAAGRHELILAAMASYYLSDPRARAGEAAQVAEAVSARLGDIAAAPMRVFALRRVLETVYYACRRDGNRHSPAAERLVLVPSGR